MNRLSTEWEKIFTRYSSDRGLLFTMYKELKKLNNKRITQLISDQTN
jgi:c-di-AMP phosphodiesterase-like protein